MNVRPLLLILLTAAVTAGCDCDCGGRDHETASARGHLDAATPPATQETPAPPAPPPTSNATPEAGGSRFGLVSLTLTIAEGRPNAAISIAVPEGASVREGEAQTASIYFDEGPPISAPLTAHEGKWQSPTLRLPSVVKTAQRAVLRIPTRPQTTIVWALTSSWQSAETAPVTIIGGTGVGESGAEAH